MNYRNIESHKQYYSIIEIKYYKYETVYQMSLFYCFTSINILTKKITNKK